MRSNRVRGEEMRRAGRKEGRKDKRKAYARLVRGDVVIVIETNRKSIARTLAFCELNELIYLAASLEVKLRRSRKSNWLLAAWLAEVRDRQSVDSKEVAEDCSGIAVWILNEPVSSAASSSADLGRWLRGLARPTRFENSRRRLANLRNFRKMVAFIERRRELLTLKSIG